MNVKNCCFHFGRRCFLNRSLVVIVVAVAASFVANCFFTQFIVLRYPPCGDRGQNLARDCSTRSSQLFADLALSVDDLKALRSQINTDVTLKENYINELSQKISLLHTEIFSLQQAKTAEESNVKALEENARRVETKLKALEANYTPKLLPPFRVVFNSSDSFVVQKATNEECSLLNCFDFSRCPLFSSLSVFLYNRNKPSDKVGMYEAATERSESCVFLYQEKGTFSLEALLYLNETNNLNHVILKNGKFEAKKVPTSLMIGAVSFYPEYSFRKGFDLLLFHVSICFSPEPKPLLPIKRKAFFSFVEFLSEKGALSRKATSHFKSLTPATGDVLKFVKVYSFGSENCKEAAERFAEFSESTFSVVIHNFEFEFGVVLSEIFHSNSIPVILYAKPAFVLPLSEVIYWQKVAIVLPAFRASEVYYLLKSLSISEIASYKLEGRRVYEQFASSDASVLLGVFGSLTRRLHLPPPALLDFEAKSAYHPHKFAPTIPMEPAPFVEDGVEISMDEYLGPAELPKPSDKFCRNFTEAFWTSNYLFNAPNSPFQQPPFPHDVALKSFNSLDFRPVGQGLGGSGRQLGLALGGNQPAEQFTIVLLTRGGDRLSILIDIVTRFRNLPYLNKVIVVWNDEQKLPTEEVKWPELIVPIFVAKMDNNSLNNRFLPFSEIETDAVLSLDDDMFLRPDEIVFAFRVWRENRDRIVGFPSRSHGWNSTSQQWIYVSSYSCEYSLVLTGAAFLHKYYFYMYTYLMPAPIRETVDKLMNCEDIAMNFLISYLTRKSPLKVTVRWTFHCPTCKTTLSKEQTHFDERSECIQRFSEIYGYNPLVFSQSRADSVLFKTRVPSTHQKCFKFV